MPSHLTIEELKYILGDVVDALPPKERDVLTALYWEGLSLNEVGRQLGKSPRQVGRIRDRAFRKMRGLVDAAS
ncbi:MAG: sigma-70 family RNA polymerase sigma factor [Candidatus Paceibacterota bacterium]